MDRPHRNEPAQRDPHYEHGGTPLVAHMRPVMEPQLVSVLRAATEQAIIATDPSGVITLFNAGAERLLGYHAAEVAGTLTLLGLHDPIEIAARAAELGIASDVEVVVAAARRGEAETREWTYVRKDRSRIAVSLTLTAMRDDRGGLRGFVGIAHDVTERRRADAALRASETRFRAAVQVARDAIISADSQGTITSWNQAAQRLFGYIDDEALGQHLTSLMPERFRDAHRRGLERATATGGLLHADQPRNLYGRRKDGTEFPLELSLATWTMDGRRFYSGIIRDSTRRKQAEAALERLSHRNQLILNAAGEGIYGVDLEGKVILVNPAALRLTGYVAADLLGHSAHDILHHSKADGSPYPLDDCPLSAALRDGAIHDVGGEVYWRKDGSSFPVEYVSTPMYDQGAIAGAVVTFKDVTERQRAEDERAQLLARERAARADAEANAERVRRVQSVTDIALAHLTLEDLLSTLLDRLREILGADTATVLLKEDDVLAAWAARGLEEEVERGVRVPLGQGFAGRIAAERRPIIIDDLDHFDVYNAILREKGIRSMLGVPLIVDGRVIGVAHVGTLRLHRFTDDDVMLLQLAADRLAVAIVQARLHDAERRARAEAETLAAERAAILGQIADGVIIADAAGRLTFANDAARRHYGIQTLGVSIAEHARLHHLFQPDGRPWSPDDLPLARALARGETVIGAETRIQRPDGQEIAALISATPLVAGDHARTGAVMTLHDVSAQRALDRQKDDFLANVSHDLRTPLAAIMTSIGVVLANEPPDIPEPLHRMLVNVERAAERLAELVDSLLELTRLQAGRTRLRREPCDLREMAWRLAGAIEPLAQARDQRVELDLPAEPVPALVDVGYLERALLNLLSNAQTYGRRGGLIRFSLERRGEEIAFAVADDGPGIAAADQAHLFERFYRPEAEATRHRQGSGLGLPIARAMVELHGGRIWVDSTPDVGTTFWITLPSGLAATASQDDTT